MWTYLKCMIHTISQHSSNVWAVTACCCATFLLTKLESGLFKSRTFKSLTSFNNLNHIYVNYWLDFILFFNMAFMKRASLGKKNLFTSQFPYFPSVKTLNVKSLESWNLVNDLKYHLKVMSTLLLLKLEYFETSRKQQEPCKKSST